MIHKAFYLLAMVPVLPLFCGGSEGLESLQALSGGYPRSFFFRNSEMAAAKPGVSYEAWGAILRTPDGH